MWVFHLGLTPRKYASGEVNYDGRITKCGDAMVRHHLYEAALVMLTRGDRWHPLKAWGLRLAKRSSMKNAFVSLWRANWRSSYIASGSMARHFGGRHG